MGEKEQPGEVSFILFVGTQEKEGQREEGKVSHFVLAGPHKKKNEEALQLPLRRVHFPVCAGESD